MTAALTDPDTNKTITVKKQQKEEGWQNATITDIGGVLIGNINSTADTTVTYTADGSGKSTGTITIDGKKVGEAVAP